MKNADKLGDSLLSAFEKIPVVGKYFDLSDIKEDFSKQVTGPLREGLMNNKLSMQSLKTIGVSSFKAIGAASKTALANPMLLVVAVVAILNVSWN